MKNTIILFALLYSTHAAAEINPASIRCVQDPKNDRLQVSIVNDKSLQAIVTLRDENQKEVVSHKEVVHSYKYSFSSYESLDHQFYLQVSRMEGTAQMLLRDSAGNTSLVNLSCEEAR